MAKSVDTNSDKSIRIVFMGTPEFAVPTLDLLIQNGYEVVGVITAPDRKAGRGRQLHTSAVKQYALAKGLNILQPTNLKSPLFLEELRALNANLQIVVAFRMLPEVVWDMPPIGTINLHASLLPEYRGAAPINWAIINGEKRTGATTFFIQHEIDTGDLLLQREVPIREDETAGELHDELMEMGAQLVLDTVQAVENNTVTPLPQQVNGPLVKAPKIFREHGAIDWSKPVGDIYNLIRGLNPYPAAYTHLHGKLFKVFNSNKVTIRHSYPLGHVLLTEEGQLRFYAADGYLDVLDVQMEGKKRMDIQSFLRGYPWPETY